MLSQTEKLCSIFNDKQFDKVNSIIKQIKNEKEEYKTTDLWTFDQTIGGIGGYCQGCDPVTSNPFQGTEFRNVYRCLQYVRSDIDILNINYTARYIIENCGYYLEEAIKLYFSKKGKINWLRIRKYPLGKLLKYIKNTKVFEEKIIEQLELFVDIYNISKHEILSDDELTRTFGADDAIIYYFACRIVGKEILIKVYEKMESQIYEIDWNKYRRDINRF